MDSIVVAPPSAVSGNVYYELEKQKLQLEKLTLDNAALRQDTAHRDRWGKRLFPLCAGWLVAVVVVLTLEGFHIYGFHLDNAVLIAFIGTTTVDVLGLGYIVVNYLFPRPQ
ncbi:MAG: hypothetical protein ACLPW4_16705 [Candidatus Sulfotelmatobacter sp.]